MRVACTLVIAAAMNALGAPGCGSESQAESVGVGLLLSYSGPLAANSINSERALTMAIEAANRAGGVGGRQVKVLARDTRSDPRLVTEPARELLNAGVAVFVGPDTVDLAVQAKAVLGERTLIMPSFTTADLNIYKPNSWFVMGAPVRRVGCEIVSQLHTDDRRNPLLVVDPRGYSSLLAFELTHTYNLQRTTLPTEGPSNEATLQPIVSSTADAFVLIALPAAASSLMYAIAVLRGLDPSRWYLSPTLHTPALLETLPKELLVGAHGVASGTVVGSQDFQTAFADRWHDTPLDDAYPFYDAGAIAVLALEHALLQEGRIPDGVGLARHIVAVTATSGVPVRWNELAHGLAVLRENKEVGYVGLSGTLDFDLTGQTPGAYTKWWTIGAAGFADIPSKSTCR